MYDKTFTIVGTYTDAVKGFRTLYVLQDDESIDRNNGKTVGRMALDIPMKYDPNEGYTVGDSVKIGFSTKYKKFYVIKERKKNE